MTNPDLQLDIRDDVAIVRLARGAKRNALSDGLILALRDTFEQLPSSVRAAAAALNRVAVTRTYPLFPARTKMRDRTLPVYPAWESPGGWPQY